MSEEHDMNGTQGGTRAAGCVDAPAVGIEEVPDGYIDVDIYRIKEFALYHQECGTLNVVCRQYGDFVLHTSCSRDSNEGARRTNLHGVVDRDWKLVLEPEAEGWMLKCHFQPFHFDTRIAELDAVGKDDDPVFDADRNNKSALCYSLYAIRSWLCRKNGSFFLHTHHFRTWGEGMRGDDTDEDIDEYSESKPLSDEEADAWLKQDSRRLSDFAARIAELDAVSKSAAEVGAADETHPDDAISRLRALYDASDKEVLFRYVILCMEKGLTGRHRRLLRNACEVLLNAVRVGDEREAARARSTMEGICVAKGCDGGETSSIIEGVMAEVHQVQCAMAG